MAIYNAVDGTVFAVTQKFLDDDEQPVIAKAGYPQVRLLDMEKSLLSSMIASPTPIPGEWTANISIPNLSLPNKQEFRVNWRFMTPNGEKIKHSDLVIIEPKVESRVSDIVRMFGDQKFVMTLPTYIGAADDANYQIYHENTPLFTEPKNLNDASTQKVNTIDRCTFTLPLAVPKASLQAYLLRADHTPDGTGSQRTYTYKLWAITPQIAMGMSFLEDFLNKSKVEQVIPELAYTDGDLINYLQRGLNLFNMIGGESTAFTGTNMQGVLFDAWVTCASYYALGAQLMAEGSLAFDFSGQGVSLNVDRTPQLEGALGRIEGVLDSRVLPLKHTLWKQGFTTGDGSAGRGLLHNSSNIGTLGILNATTTRLNGFGTQFQGRRW